MENLLLLLKVTHYRLAMSRTVNETRMDFSVQKILVIIINILELSRLYVLFLFHRLIMNQSYIT